MTTDVKTEIIIGATATDLSDIIDFVLAGDDGFGMPDVERLTERSPNQDGVTDRGFVLKPRILSLRLMSIPTDITDYYNLRDQLLKLFKPRSTAFKIRRTVAGGVIVRQCDGHMIGGGKFPNTPGTGQASDEVFQVMGPNPTLYDPTQQSTTWTIASGGLGFIFPLIFPVTFGASNMDETKVIAYTGSWREYPIIEIKGPITDCVITNVSTGDKLDFTGYTVPQGTTVTVDCGFDQKTVKDQAGNNLIEKLSNDSDLGTFSIEPDPDVAGGNNSLKVTGYAGNAVTEVKLLYYRRYIGM